jgi:hypothetical protein
MCLAGLWIVSICPTVKFSEGKVTGYSLKITACHQANLLINSESFLKECQSKIEPLTVLGYYRLGYALFIAAGIIVLIHVDEYYNVRILLYSPTLSKVVRVRFLALHRNFRHLI